MFRIDIQHIALSEKKDTFNAFEWQIIFEKLIDLKINLYENI